MPNTLQFASGFHIPSAQERFLGLINFRLRLEQNWTDVAKSQSKYYNQKHLAKAYKVGDQI